MANPRYEIETGIETELATVSGLKTVKSIGGQDYGEVLKAALAKAPFALVKYIGKTPDVEPGGQRHNAAEISILIGAKSFKSIQAQKQTIYDLLDDIEAALDGKRIGSADGDDVYWPLEQVAELWSEMSGSGLEVWEQRYLVQWDSTPAYL